MKKIALITLIALIACARGVSAQTLLVSTTEPTVGTTDIANYETPNAPLNGSEDYSNNAAPGQTFTTGSSTLGYDLNSVTVETAGGGGSLTSDTFDVTIYSVAANGTANYGFTPLAQYSFTDTTGATLTNSYLTFELPSSVALKANTLYAYTINGTNGSYLGFAEGGANDYAGGTAINDQGGYDAPPSSTATSFTTNTGDGYDRDFDIGLTAIGDSSAIPEPRTWALFGMGLAGMIFMVRRRLNA